MAANAPASMTISEAIRSRRTIFSFKPGAVPTDVLESILDAGRFGPNHLLTEPWRFTIIGEKTRLIMADRYAEIQVEKVMNVANDEQKKSVAQKGYEKWMSKPTLVAVSYVLSDNPVQLREDFAATCCAMLNIQLAGWEQGVGMQWTTGSIINEPNTYRLLDIDPTTEEIIGFYYMGYPAEVPVARRKPLNEVLRRTP